MKRFTPMHLRAVQLNWEGHSNGEIAQILNRSTAWVSTTLASPEALEIMKRLENKVLDTSVQVQSLLQAAAPVALSRKIQLMHSANDHVANKATQEILELAGHVPLRQLEIRRPDHVEEEFRDKTEQEIRQQILQQLDIEEPKKKGEDAVERLLH